MNPSENSENVSENVNANAPETEAQAKPEKAAKAPRKPGKGKGKPEKPETLSEQVAAFIEKRLPGLRKVKVPQFAEPTREKGEALTSWCARVLQAEKAYRVQHGDEKASLKTALETLMRETLAKFELGSQHTRLDGTRVRNTYTPEQKAKAVAAMSIPSDKPGYKPVSVISTEMGIHPQTLNIWKKEAGLVKSRK